jgi:MFS family permease
MGLGGNTVSLLATGVVGIVEFLFTIPAVLWVDQIGRKKILIAGAIGMASCHFIVAGIIGAYQHTFDTHKAAGWVAIVFVWIFVINFAYSWGMSGFLRCGGTLLTVISPQDLSPGLSLLRYFRSACVPRVLVLVEAVTG